MQDALLEHPTLSLNARTVLAWMLGRPGGWEIQISYMLSKLSITDNVWRTVKKDLVRHGFFSQTRIQTEGGKFIWMQEATDEPLYIDKPDTTKNHPLKTTNGLPTHGKPRIEQDIYKQDNFTIPPTKPFPPKQIVVDDSISENVAFELDLTVSHQLEKVLAQSKTLSVEITNQQLADALESSLRLGETTGNKVKIPRKVLDYLKTLSVEELLEWGQPVAVEREKQKIFAKRQLAIEYSFQHKPDAEAQQKGERMLQKVRSDRQLNK